MKKLTVALCTALLLTGCGTSEKASSDNRTATTANTATTTTKPETTTATTSAPTSGVTGVAACDDYLAKVETCLSKPNVPEAAKQAYRQSLEQNRTAWKQAASTPQGKASLESSCKMAMDSAKQFFDSCK